MLLLHNRYTHEPINVAWYRPTSDESANSGSLDMTQRPDKTGNAAAPATSTLRFFPLRPKRPRVIPLPPHRARMTDAPCVACTRTQPTRPAYKTQLRQGHVCSAVLTNSKSSSDGPIESVLMSVFTSDPVTGDAGSSLCVTMWMGTNKRRAVYAETLRRLVSLRMRGVGARGIGSSFCSAIVLLDEGEELEARVRTTRLATLDVTWTAKGRRSRYRSPNVVW